MLNRFLSFVMLAVSVILSNSTETSADAGVTDFDRTLQSILPTRDEEVWTQIPWQTNLTAARLDAQNQHKPLFLWVMNGHPLGCT
jgi:hypothetical protein